MSGKALASKQTLIGAAVLFVILLGSGIWLYRSAEIRSQYVAAAADCENGRGIGLLRALDAIHGEDARPTELQLSLSMCEMTDGVDSYLRAKAASDHSSN